MAKLMLLKVRNEAVKAFLSGRTQLAVFGVTVRILHAHSNQYQVVLPDGAEIFRLVRRSPNRLSVYEV